MGSIAGSRTFMYLLLSLSYFDGIYLFMKSDLCSRNNKEHKTHFHGAVVQDGICMQPAT